MTKNEFFFRLTPDRVMHAIEQLGLNPSGRWLQLNSMENRVFSIALDDGSHIVVKFYRPERWTRQQILEEHEFLFQLQEAEVPVCAPLRFNGESLHIIEDIYYAVWPRTGGRSIDEFTDEHLEMLGRLLARIHDVGERHAASGRPVFDATSYVYTPLEFLENKNFIPAECTDQFRQAAESVATLFIEYSKGVPMHRIHGDCHPGNLLYGKEGFFFLDFDDCVTGPAVQDFWMIIQDKGAAGYRKRQIFLEGYATFSDYQPHWLKLSEILRAVRYIHYTAWIAKRWEDPSFPRAFPHFGSDGYWIQETKDLQQQLIHIEEELELTPSAPAVEELSNKDFFWDM